jgi:hypothetical protein
VHKLALTQVRLVLAFGLAAASPLAAQGSYTEVRKPAVAVQKAAFSCTAPQLAFQKPTGQWICIAPDSNPCPQGQVLDTTTKPGFAGCKPGPPKPPITCPTGQLGFQKPTGQWICIAPDSNPCPQGQVLDTTTKPGFAGCKPGPPKAPITCPTGQVPFQKPDGRYVCVAKS